MTRTVMTTPIITLLRLLVAIFSVYVYLTKLADDLRLACALFIGDMAYCTYMHLIATRQPYNDVYYIGVCHHVEFTSHDTHMRVCPLRLEFYGTCTGFATLKPMCIYVMGLIKHGWWE